MSKYRRLDRSDRYQIEEGLSRDKRVVLIAANLGVHRSTVYREINRGKITVGVTGGKKKGEYSAREAHRRFLSTFFAVRRGCVYRGVKIKGWVEDQIIIRVTRGWSPQQIGARLKMEKGISISTEAIYKYILAEKRRGSQLHKYLRHYRGRMSRFKRRSRYWDLQYQRRKSIDLRPHEANQRVEPGHWERDLMMGRRKSGALVVAVDRKSHYTLLARVVNTTAEEVNKKTSELLAQSGLPCKTITNDNGHEFGEFWNLEKDVNAPVYFTHALCPWERGTVENTIGLLRQFVPKGSDMNTFTDEDIKNIEFTINSRPRRALGYKTPIEVTTGKAQKLITKKRIETSLPDDYAQFFQQ